MHRRRVRQPFTVHHGVAECYKCFQFVLLFVVESVVQACGTALSDIPSREFIWSGIINWPLPWPP